ncbi:hypothetical protein [Aureimonas leprariae]|uniref:DUF945 domain-containing protein n=1 Tax=Plantimonas leprariae TaxID=2615207 RepID=A0A7V7PQU3_9HYPH|nr:hypothetical protein [Aureimonas leprariae]KAB0680700.1 hypothetical protein F6X38_06755 [Aureimonas leprariae]
MRASASRAVLASLGLLLAGSASALAADAQAFANRLKDAVAASSLPMSFAGAESQGDNVVVKGVTFGTGPDAAKLGDVTFEGVTGSDADGWKVTRVPIADVDQADGDKRIQARGMVVSGIQIAPKDKPSTLPGEAPWFFDSAAVQGVEGTESGKPVFSLGATSFTNSVASGGAIDSNFTLGDLKLDFTATKDDEAAKTMTAVGYPQLAGNGTMHMNWDPKSGDLTLDPFTLDFQNAGKFDVAYMIKGYTPAFAKQLSQIQNQMASQPDQASQSGMAIIGLLSQLSIGSLQVGFTDASLTNKLLDYFAKENGTTREQLADSLSQMAPQSLAALNNPEFQAQVAGAISAFLKDPKSIKVEVKPTQPIPATQIIGAAMGAPQTLPNVLQLKVTANTQ